MALTTEEVTKVDKLIEYLETYKQELINKSKVFETKLYFLCSIYKNLYSSELSITFPLLHKAIRTEIDKENRFDIVLLYGSTETLKMSDEEKIQDTIIEIEGRINFLTTFKKLNS